MVLDEESRVVGDYFGVVSELLQRSATLRNEGHEVEPAFDGLIKKPLYFLSVVHLLEQSDDETQVLFGAPSVFVVSIQFLEPTLHVYLPGYFIVYIFPVLSLLLSVARGPQKP